MINAREEFLKHIKNRVVKCARISGDEDDAYWSGSADKIKCINLPVGYTEENMKNFLYAIDIDYDNGYGGQNLFGTIWYTDGSWSERGEYDGSEWWEHRKVPAIPEELNK